MLPVACPGSWCKEQLYLFKQDFTKNAMSLFEKFNLKHGNTEVASFPEESADEETTAAFEQDANLHGTSYAKWKRQMLKDMGEEDDDYYDDDINEVDEF